MKASHQSIDHVYSFINIGVKFLDADYLGYRFIIQNNLFKCSNLDFVIQFRIAYEDYSPIPEYLYRKKRRGANYLIGFQSQIYANIFSETCKQLVNVTQSDVSNDWFDAGYDIDFGYNVYSNPPVNIPIKFAVHNSIIQNQPFFMTGEKPIPYYIPVTDDRAPTNSFSPLEDITQFVRSNPSSIGHYEQRVFDWCAADLCNCDPCNVACGGACGERCVSHDPLVCNPCDFFAGADVCSTECINHDPSICDPSICDPSDLCDGITAVCVDDSGKLHHYPDLQSAINIVRFQSSVSMIYLNMEVIPVNSESSFVVNMFYYLEEEFQFYNEMTTSLLIHGVYHKSGGSHDPVFVEPHPNYSGPKQIVEAYSFNILKANNWKFSNFKMIFRYEIQEIIIIQESEGIQFDNVDFETHEEIIEGSLAAETALFNLYNAGLTLKNSLIEIYTQPGNPPLNPGSEETESGVRVIRKIGSNPLTVDNVQVSGECFKFIGIPDNYGEKFSDISITNSVFSDCNFGIHIKAKVDGSKIVINGNTMHGGFPGGRRIRFAYIDMEYMENEMNELLRFDFSNNDVSGVISVLYFEVTRRDTLGGEYYYYGMRRKLKKQETISTVDISLIDNHFENFQEGVFFSFVEGFISAYGEDLVTILVMNNYLNGEETLVKICGYGTLLVENNVFVQNVGSFSLFSLSLQESIEFGGGGFDLTLQHNLFYFPNSMSYCFDFDGELSLASTLLDTSIINSNIFACDTCNNEVFRSAQFSPANSVTVRNNIFYEKEDEKPYPYYKIKSPRRSPILPVTPQYDMNGVERIILTPGGFVTIGPFEFETFFCFEKWTGEDGECYNHGYCSSDTNCTCDIGWDGDQCQNITNDVFFCFGKWTGEEGECSNHGYCNSDGNCTCDNGWEGDQCQNETYIEVPPPPPPSPSVYWCWDRWSNQQDVCSGHGTCIKTNNCRCNLNYNGRRCQHFKCDGIDHLNPTVCNGFGTCVDHDTCRCNSGFSTTTNGCDTCDNTKCSGTGICAVTGVGSYSCSSCGDGITGSECNRCDVNGKLGYYVDGYCFYSFFETFCCYLFS